MLMVIVLLIAYLNSACITVVLWRLHCNYFKFKFFAGASCCEVPRTFLYNNVTAVREGRQYVVGVLVTCSSGYYAAICQDESDVGELCSTLLDFDGKFSSFFCLSINFTFLSPHSFRG